jgi:hypothetical protein
MPTPQESAYCSIIIEKHRSSLSRSITASPDTLISMCQVLYSKRFIDESLLNKVESPNTSVDDKRDSFMGFIEKAVSDDHRKLRKLALVLDQFKEMKPVAKKIIDDYSE